MTVSPGSRHVPASDGTMLRVIEHEPDTVTRETFVWLHALGCDATMWDAVIAELGPSAHSIAVDLRGHGESEFGTHALTMPLIIDDIRCILAAMAADRVHLVGCSLGGLIAQSVAIELQQRISTLTLVNTAAAIGTPSGWSERQRQVRRNGLSSLGPVLVDRFFSPAFADAEPDATAETINVTARTNVDAYLAACDLLASTDETNRIDRITTPTCVVAGSVDISTTVDQARFLVDHIPNSELVVLDGVGHLAPIEAPGRVASAVRALSSTAPRTASGQTS